MEVVTEEPTTKRVPEGYKRTEIGLIPTDWEIVEITEVTDLITDGAHLSPPTDKYGLPIATVENLKKGSIDLESCRKISPEDFDRLVKGNCKPELGDVLVSKDGTIGISITIEEEDDVVLLSSIALVRPKRDRVVSKYLSKSFSSDWFFKYLNKVKSGSALKRIVLRDLRSYYFPLPPTLEEQQAIAESLSDVDALIAELDALIEKKQQVKKGAMQQLLTGKKRLPGFDVLWEEKKLGDVANIVMGSSPSSDNYNEDGYGLPLIGGNADIKNRKSIKRVWTTQIPKKCNTGEVIMTVRAPVGTIAIASTESCLGRGVCALQVNTLDKSFLFYQMIFNESEWEALEQGSTFTSANSKQIEEFSILVPENKEEQKAIAGILSDMDAEIQVLQAKRSKYEKIKQGMMQELLTGKTRLIKKEEESHKADGQSKPSHNWEFDEAILVSVLADRFGTKEFPLGRFRRTKYSYLVRRHLESKVDQFLKKVAGPYNPKTRYRGPEKIALNNGYVKEWENGKRKGFIANDNIDQAWNYFETWHGQQAIDWLEERFRYVKNKELELLTTVDKARIELEEENREVTLSTVKEVIESHLEWQPKLEKDLFSDEKIEGAIKESFELLK